MTNRVRRAILLVSAAVVLVAMGSFTVRADPKGAKATLTNGAGATVGIVEFAAMDGAVEVEAKNVSGLPSGFHGFHVHAVGSCVGPTFASAGGHFAAPGANHPGHAGDMPVLLVNADGTASAVFRTDRFSVSDIIGRAVIIHALPDNYANIPLGPGATQYTANSAEATALTFATGNAGGRIACGVVEED